ncbi:hypothetical protein AB0H88_07390 [Nonomuraea sp. NPDC050680]|uniref:hypothetical protein n=1 Tax=Nonomuraea sp. NPDC050680 TaxID=3154630 RepID=UPI00340DC621
MTAREQYERFDHLARLGWELHCLGIRVSLVVPVTGRPVLEMLLGNGTTVHITAIRRYCEWVFTWRPWWARLWRRDKWVVAQADNAAAIIVAEVDV